MIWVFAGTTEGVELTKQILMQGEKVLASTATEYGGSLLGKHENLTIISKPLDFGEICEMIKKYNISKIIDTTHPYAIEVSDNIKKAAKQTGIAVERIIRQESVIQDDDHIILVDDYRQSIDILKEKQGNILITTGSNKMELFCNELNLNRLYFRVLPTVSAMEKCEKLGLKPNQIIAMQGPFSEMFNHAVIEQFDIKYLVTKESGKIGGFEEKIYAVKETGIMAIAINRPKEQEEL